MMNIASYYLNSPVFLAMTQNNNFKSITIDELLTNHSQYLRDDSSINDDDEEDFIFTLVCLTYWGVEKLPIIVYDYINHNLFIKFTSYHETIISSIFIDEIQNYIKNKFNKYKTIACGDSHSVGIRNDTSVVVWGCRGRRQANETPRDSFIEVTAGMYHSIAIKEDGTLIAWGDEYFDRRGDLPEGNFIRIACGDDYSIGIKDNGYLIIWCNSKEISFFRKRNFIIPDGKFIEVAAGNEYLFAIREDGIIVDLKYTYLRQPNYSSNYKDIMTHLPEGKFIQIASGHNFSSAIREDGTIITWKNIKSKKLELLPSPEGKFIKIACGYNFASAIRDNGTIITWFIDNINKEKENYEKIINSPKGRFLQIACGRSHLIAIREDGIVGSWGDDQDYQQDNVPKNRMLT
jgi:alpha-tubulin suppressor-like RCC1 family protein